MPRNYIVVRDSWPSKTLAVTTSANSAIAPAISTPLDVPSLSKRLGVRESPAPPRSTAQWEMVIPKMDRPVAKAMPVPLSPSAPTPAPEFVLTAAPESVPAAASTMPAPQSGSAGDLFRTASLLTEKPSVQERVKRVVFAGWNAIPSAWKIGAAAALMTAASVLVWLRPDSPRKAASVPGRISAGTWIRERASFASAEPRIERQLILFRTAQDETNCSLEFDWKADSKGVGWVFRNSGTGNYYGGHIALLPSPTSPMLSVEHFTVIAGTESDRFRKTVPYSGNPLPIRVRMEVSEAAFTLYAEGKSVDYWIDRRLGSGDTGFYQENGEQPSIDFVQISLLKPPAQGYAGPFQTLLRSIQ
jgi:hypothetical protein